MELPNSQDYPWYRVIQDDSLEQGDVLLRFQVVQHSLESAQRPDELRVDLLKLDVVVITQSCDLEQGKARSLVLCPLYSLETMIRNSRRSGQTHWSSSDVLERLRQGNAPGYHLVNEFAGNGLVLPISVVDFHDVYSSPVLLAKRFVADNSPRLRLCPPYREHLAQAFARFFMRVGLPEDISKESLKAIAQTAKTN